MSYTVDAPRRSARIAAKKLATTAPAPAPTKPSTPKTTYNVPTTTSRRLRSWGEGCWSSESRTLATRAAQEDPLPSIVTPTDVLQASRQLFLERFGTSPSLTDYAFHGVQDMYDTITKHLKVIEEAEGSNAKAEKTIALFQYLIQKPLLLAISPRFHQTMLNKIAELREDCSRKLTDPQIRVNLLAVLADMATIIAHNPSTSAVSTGTQ